MAVGFICMMCIGTTVVVGLCLSLGLLLRSEHCMVSSISQSWASLLIVASNPNEFCILNVFRVGMGEFFIITLLIL